MFTGIITGVGRIAAVHDLGSSLQHGKRLTVQVPAGGEVVADVELSTLTAAEPATVRGRVHERAPAGVITVDFSGSSPASLFGINSPRTYTHAYAVFGLKAVIAPHVPNNIGSLSCLTSSPSPAPWSIR